MRELLEKYGRKLRNNIDIDIPGRGPENVERSPSSRLDPAKNLCFPQKAESTLFCFISQEWS